ncbi:MAG: hypothetical protein ACOYJE_05025 [Bacteroidaceae bacterium]
METNKKYFNRLAGGAVLLAGALAFTACSSDEDFVEAAAPGSNVTGETVKTQFSIAVPGTNSVNKRLGNDVVQAEGQAFRGMSNILLVPFALTGTPTSLSGTENIPADYIELTDIKSLEAQGSYKVYNDVEVATGTNWFLFYGEALAKEGTPAAKVNGSLKTPFETGNWPAATTTALNTIQFELEGILGSSSVTEAQTAYEDMLDAIAGAAGWSTESGNDFYSYYQNFITLKAGSANSIRAALTELYESAISDEYKDGTQAQAVASKIMEYYNYADGVLTEKDNVSITNYADFPADLGLPDGSMQLNHTADGFEYVTPSTSVTDGNILQQTAYADYVYPASLYYTVSTPIKVDNQTHAENGVYSAVSNWSDVLNLFNTGGTAVEESTKSIVLQNAVQYAVGNLQLFVRFADANIYDNGALWPDESNAIGQRTVIIPTGGFPLTGVLIGGQKSVGWDFKPIDNTSAGQSSVKEQTIYDASMMENAAVKKSAAQAATPVAYTLALETKGGNNTTAESVRFAIEMTNTSGNDFVGKDGIVPAGGKFYLVGELKSETESAHKGESPILKVFQQDYTTVANVTINSLKSAYNCIPDLRSPKLELGLSVDLNWTKGLVTDVTID